MNNLYRLVFKRLFDFSFSIIAIIALSPLMLIIFIGCIFSTKEKGLFIQTRIGLNNKGFNLYKFKSMKGTIRADRGIASLSNSRVTRFGSFLRKTHLDELPQFFMVLSGQMSIVGPRPEVPEIISHIDHEDVIKFTNNRPGLISPASLKYINEEEILARTDNPEELYITQLLPDKIQMNIDYCENITLLGDLRIMINYLLIILSIK